MQNRTIVGIGETVLDIVFRNNQPQAAVPGGSVFNAMVSLGRTAGRLMPGTRLMMASQAGDDAVAGIITDFMRENHLDTSLIQQDPGQTTISVAMLNDGGNARYEFYRDKGLPAFRTPQIRFQPEDLMLFGSFFAVSEATGRQTRELVQAAREAGAIVYYDINFRRKHEVPPSVIEANIALCDVVRGSDEDIEALYGCADPARVYREHIAACCPRFICTRGAQPTEVVSPGLHRTFPAPEVERIASTGQLQRRFPLRHPAPRLHARTPAGDHRSRLGAARAHGHALLGRCLREPAELCPSGLSALTLILRQLQINLRKNIRRLICKLLIINSR